MLKVTPDLQIPFIIHKNKSLSFKGNDEPQVPDCIDNAVKKYCKPGITPKILISRLKEKVSEERYTHCIGVSQRAAQIAKEHDLDSEKAALAGLLHDYAKNTEDEILQKIAQEKGIKIMPEEKIRPKLLHAPISAHSARKDFGIIDPEILSAIEHHGLGSKNPEKNPLSSLDMVLIIADKTEPFKKTDEKKQKITDVLQETGSLHKAVATSFNIKIRSYLERFQPVYMNDVANYNVLLAGAE